MPGPTFVVGSLTYISDLNALSNATLTFSPGQTVNFNALKGNYYGLEANALQVTLPASPAIGDLMRFSAKSSAITSVTLLRNGNNIDSAAADYTVAGNTDRALNFWLVYWSASVGWRPILPSTGGLAWGGVQSSTFTAAKNTHYALATGGFNITMPASPAPMDIVRFTIVDHTAFAFQFMRNGSNINSAAFDYLVLAKGWDAWAIYLDATRGWVFIFESTINPGVRYDSASNEMRYHNTQREVADTVGWAAYALPIGDSISTSHATNNALPISGGSVAVPIVVEGHMLLDNVVLSSGDTTGAHTGEWRLYKQQLNNGNAGEKTLTEVPGANGTWSYTSAAVGPQVSAAIGAPVYLSPGFYWLVIRNTSALTTLGVRYAAITATDLANKGFQTQTLGSGLSSTLDMVTGWTISALGVLGVKLVGRVFGNTSATYI